MLSFNGKPSPVGSSLGAALPLPTSVLPFKVFKKKRNKSHCLIRTFEHSLYIVRQTGVRIFEFATNHSQGRTWRHLILAAMTSSSALVSLSLLAALVISSANGACTRFFTAEDAQSVNVPSNLDPELIPPQGNVPIAQLFGLGAQHYTANGTAWVLTSATAELFNSRFENIGVHFYLPHADPKGGQPSWKTPCPRSLVTAKRVFTAPVQNNNIPWVLLEATNSQGSWWVWPFNPPPIASACLISSTTVSLCQMFEKEIPALEQIFRLMP